MSRFLARRGLAVAASAVSAASAPRVFSPHEALERVCKPKKKRNFPETVEVLLALNLDPKQQNQALRVVADLPSGTGKATRVAVFTNDNALAKAATDAGAYLVGGSDLIAELAAGRKIDFAKTLAGTDVMPALTKQLGKTLGTQSLMPSKKLGSVLESAGDLAAAVKRAKAGAVELRVDRTGVVRAGIGKISMPTEALVDNLKAVMLCVENNRPSGVKGRFFRSLYVKSSMGPSFRIPHAFVDPKSQYFFSPSSAVLKTARDRDGAAYKRPG